MNTHFTHFLRMFRKKYNIAQSDIAFLLEMKDSSLICKIEAGKRMPNFDIILMYHLLFGVPLKDFFPRQCADTVKKIINGIDLLIPLIQEEASHLGQERIASLKRIQSQLMNKHPLSTTSSE